jgi:hypothetical protein
MVPILNEFVGGNRPYVNSIGNSLDQIRILNTSGFNSTLLLRTHCNKNSQYVSSISKNSPIPLPFKFFESLEPRALWTLFPWWTEPHATRPTLPLISTVPLFRVALINTNATPYFDLLPLALILEESKHFNSDGRCLQDEIKSHLITNPNYEIMSNIYNEYLEIKTGSSLGWSANPFLMNHYYKVTEKWYNSDFFLQLFDKFKKDQEQSKLEETKLIAEINAAKTLTYTQYMSAAGYSSTPINTLRNPGGYTLAENPWQVTPRFSYRD